MQTKVVKLNRLYESRRFIKVVFQASQVLLYTDRGERESYYISDAPDWIRVMYRKVYQGVGYRD